jgi:hypothetical protein
MLRIPHCLDNRLIDGGKVVSHTVTILDIFHRPVSYREIERRKLWGGSVRHYHVGGGYSKHNLAVWKVPRRCPLVLLVKDLINFEFKDVGAAVVGEM